ncbi:hypothetical protein EMIT0158MI4_70337 [Burkholderia ambifaria]
MWGALGRVETHGREDNYLGLYVSIT